MKNRPKIGDSPAGTVLAISNDISLTVLDAAMNSAA
jgi:hypothetical protein